MWEQIQSNRRRSAFVVSALGVMLVVTGAALGGVFGGGATAPMLIGGCIALAIWAVMWLVSRSKGDDIMLQIARAREIDKADHPQLINVVEEMTIASASGKRPRVFIVDDPSPNAFAVGRNPDTAAVAVTTGLLSILDRNELQGVIAHEMAHIRNRDVALMTTAGIMLGSIVLLAEIGRRALWFGGGMRRSRSSSGKDSGNAVLMIVAIILVILAPILAQLLYFSLSRKREYLADASGARFTRYPEGLASALEKLGGASAALADTSKVTAPMYIVRPLAGDKPRKLNAAFSTHPPLDGRIKILRGMGNSASLRDYESAYRKQHGGDALIGTRALADDRSGAEVAAAVATPPPVDDSTPVSRSRQASDAFLAASGYLRRTCDQCGAIHKIPPQLATRLKHCTRCKATLPLS